jgi:hypothetical protein
MAAQFDFGQSRSPFGFNEAIAPRMEGTTVREADLARLWPAVKRTVAPGHRRPSYSRAEAERWYSGYVAECRAKEMTPSRDQDLRAAREQPGLKRIPGVAVRELRSKHAPDEWTHKGRREGEVPGRR